MDMWKERSSHACLSTTEFRVVASPLKIHVSHVPCKAGQGIEAVPCLKAGRMALQPENISWC